MKVHIEKLEALTIVSVEGEVELSDDLAQIKSTTDQCESGHENLILDLSNVKELQFLDFLGNMLEKQDYKQKSFVLCGVNAKLQLSLDKNYEEDYFNIVPTRNEAVDMVYMEEQERSLFN